MTMHTVPMPRPGLRPGDVAPWFIAPTLGQPNFRFETLAGRYVLLLFVASAGDEASAAALRMLAAHRALLDDERALFFGVTRDPEDSPRGRIAHMLPGIRWFLDFQGNVARQYGALDAEGVSRPHWVLLDPMLRVVVTADVSEGEHIFSVLRALSAAPLDPGHAPVLIVPRVFEPSFCRHLIQLYENRGGEPSGFMREIDGKTTGVLDHQFKRRSDLSIMEEELRHQIRLRILSRLVPMIHRAFAFRATRIERYIVACYDGDGDGGFFRAHRDNTSAGTAHRRFACTINLNADEYDGGDLTFPEFGMRRYRAPTGGAVVFACGLLHEAHPVTRGKRYACLPFLYDEAAAKQREEIAQSGRVSEELASYRAT